MKHNETKGTQMKEIYVLGNSFVKYDGHFGDELHIVNKARMSYQGKSKGVDKDMKLLRRLYIDKHTSPFEQANISFVIRMPIFVMRQFVRHRTFRLNEVSARYTKLDMGVYIPSKWRLQDTKNKQSSTNTDDLDHEEFSDALEYHCSESFSFYESLLKKGIAREMARMVLPLNTLTEIAVNIDMNNLLKYFHLRDDNHAQWEHQEIARAMKQITHHYFPNIMKMYEELRRDLCE